MYDEFERSMGVVLPCILTFIGLLF